MSLDQFSPLKDLYADKNAMPVLTYPHDLGTARKGHFISFSVMIPQKSTYKDTSGVSSSAIASVNPMAALSTAQQALNSAATTASQASALGETIGSIANAANEALTTANQIVGTAVGVVGTIGTAAANIQSAVATGSATAAISGTMSGLNTLASVASIPGVSSFLNDPMQAASNTWDAIKNFTNNIDKAFSGDAPAAAGAPTESDGPAFSPRVMKPSGYINLYMPDTVSMAQHASYGEINMTEALGAVGGMLEGYEAGSRIGASLADAAKAGGIGGAVKTLTDGNYEPMTIEMASKVLGKKTEIPVFGKGKYSLVNNAAAVSAYLLKTEGYAINPQFEVVFSQMDFRKFQFDFTFTPKSPEEAQTIRDIIKLFRMHSAPEIHGGSSGVGGRYFDVPSVFQIEYKHMEETNSNLHKFAPAVLETIIVDYAPEVGWVTYDDGMPVKTRMTLQFKEMKILTRSSIEGGM